MTLLKFYVVVNSLLQIIFSSPAIQQLLMGMEETAENKYLYMWLNSSTEVAHLFLAQ